MSTRAARVTRGAGWIYSYRLVDRLLGFVALAVLARILSPDDFGLVAIAASVVAIIEGLSDFDPKQALIQSRDEDRELYDSAWTLSSLRGALAAAVMLGVAPFVGDPRIASILYVLALSPLVEGFSNPRFVMFERDLVYSKLAVLTLVGTAASLAVTLFVAIVYRSYWALVLGIVARSLVTLVSTYALRPYRPRVTLAKGYDILRFSGWMSLGIMATTLSQRTDRIIVGALLGVTSTGGYYMTLTVGSLPTNELISPLQRILFPSFSQMSGEPARLRRAVLESVNVLGSLSLPAAFGFAVTANDFVPLVLGEQWLSITPLLIVLVPYFGLRSSLSSARSCVMALGKTRLMFRASFVYALVHLPVFIVGTARFGLRGSIWAIVLAGAFYVYLNAWLLEKSVQISIPEISGQLARPLLAAVALVIAVGVTQLVMPIDLFSEAGSWASILIKVAVGVVVYGASLYALWRLQGRPAGFEQRLLETISR